MRTLFVLCLFAGFLSLPVAFAQSTGAAAKSKAPTQEALPKPEGCAKCATAIAPDAGTIALKTIPGTNETMPVGQVENLIPIGVLTVLGCEKCAAEAVRWALQQGSTFADIERTLQTVAAMQKLDCFKNQFGPDAVSRLEKPLAAAKEALEQARKRAAK
jgi:alkylhydroperoxidase/carboxymuconolactone decarboxylase family protein YurZ